MKIEIIKGAMNVMNCLECGSSNNNFDERIGEIVCIECGFVIVQNMFEERTSLVDSKGNLLHSKDTHRLGSMPKSHSLERGLAICNMVLSNVMVNHPLKDEVEKTYLECQRKNVFLNISLETRACAIVYYCLKNNATPIPLKEIIKEYDCAIKLVRKTIKKIVKFYNNVHLNNKTQPLFLVEQMASKISTSPKFISRCRELCEELEEKISLTNYNKRPSHYVALCYLVKIKYKYKISRNNIAEKTGFSTKTITTTANELSFFLGYRNVKEMKGEIKNVE